MNLVETVTTPGQNISSTQQGSIYTDDAQGRMVVYDGVNNRMVIGLYKGEVIIAISKPGQDVFEALDA